MIRIPYCLMCEHCGANMVCTAFPDGIPAEVLHKEKADGEICNHGISFKRLKEIKNDGDSNGKG